MDGIDSNLAAADAWAVIAEMCATNLRHTSGLVTVPTRVNLRPPSGLVTYEGYPFICDCSSLMLGQGYGPVAANTRGDQVATVSTSSYRAICSYTLPTHRNTGGEPFSLLSWVA